MKCGMSRIRHMDGVLESVSAKLKDIGIRFGKQLRTFGVGRTILLIIGKVLKWYNILAGAKDAVVCVKIKNDLNNAYKWADKLGNIPHDSLAGGGNYFSKTTAFEAIHGEINISFIIQMLKRLIGVGLGIAIEKASQFGRNDSNRIADDFKQAKEYFCKKIKALYEKTKNDFKRDLERMSAGRKFLYFFAKIVQLLSVIDMVANIVRYKQIMRELNEYTFNAIAQISKILHIQKDVESDVKKLNEAGYSGFARQYSNAFEHAKHSVLIQGLGNSIEMGRYEKLSKLLFFIRHILDSLLAWSAGKLAEWARKSK